MLTAVPKCNVGLADLLAENANGASRPSRAVNHTVDQREAVGEAV